MVLVEKYLYYAYLCQVCYSSLTVLLLLTVYPHINVVIEVFEHTNTVWYWPLYWFAISDPIHTIGEEYHLSITPVHCRLPRKGRGVKWSITVSISPRTNIHHSPCGVCRSG